MKYLYILAAFGIVYAVWFMVATIIMTNHLAAIGA
jgi:hypothetical protein